MNNLLELNTCEKRTHICKVMLSTNAFRAWACATMSVSQTSSFLEGFQRCTKNTSVQTSFPVISYSFLISSSFFLRCFSIFERSVPFFPSPAVISSTKERRWILTEVFLLLLLLLPHSYFFKRKGNRRAGKHTTKRSARLILLFSSDIRLLNDRSRLKDIHVIVRHTSTWFKWTTAMVHWSKSKQSNFSDKSNLTRTRIF